MTNMPFIGTPLAFAFVLGVAAAASAQVYPSRPVTLIVPFPAGGGVDAMARITAERLTAAFGQQVVIDNRGGAAGALARTQEHLDVGTPPPGTENYLAAELFKSMTGINMTIVSYKGTGPLTNDLVGGHISVAFNTIAPALGNIQAGHLRAIAVAGRTRSSLLPDVPTVGESGLPGFEATVRYGLLAPIGTPRPIIDRINSEL